jgi:hypothetical protein
MPTIIDRRGITSWERRWIALMTHASYALAHLSKKRFPLTAVTGYPKSGTVWVTQLVADYLELPFIDLSFFPVGCPAVIHTHFPVPSRKGVPMVYVVRDGRDAMISMFYYLQALYKTAEGGNGRAVLHHLCKTSAASEIRNILPEFIHRQFRKPYGCRLNWKNHIQSALRTQRTDVPIVRYERLLVDPIHELGDAIVKLTAKPIDEKKLAATIEKFTFRKRTGRNPGAEQSESFLRSGTSGQWRRYFTRDSARVFNEFAGGLLVDLGYEEDDTWVNQLPPR